MRIAIADDDAEIIAFLTKVIDGMGYQSVAFNDGERLTQALLRDTFDLVLLDWSMPGRNGLDVIRWMQETLEDAPAIIMMTNRTAKEDISAALTAGADDYITKPEEDHVIAARIASVLRRSGNSGAMEKIAHYGVFTFDRINQKVILHGEEITLTAKEFELADMLFRNRDRTLSRAYLMEMVWRTSASLATRTLDMHVSRLRSKLHLGPENGFRIFTVFGYGYRLETLAPVGD